MSRINKIARAPLGAALAGALALGLAAATFAAPAAAQPSGAVAPTNDVTLSVGAGRMVRLNGAMTDLFVANDTIADVQVRSPSQIYIFGRAAGNTTVYATDRAGRVVYSANVRVGQNLGSVDQLLDMAMPEADIQATTLERHGAAHRIGRLAIRRRGGRAPRPGVRRRGHAGGQPAAHRDSAAGHAAGPDRRGEPLVHPLGRRQPRIGRQHERLPVRRRPGPRRRSAVHPRRSLGRRRHRGRRPAPA